MKLSKEQNPNNIQSCYRIILYLLFSIIFIFGSCKTVPPKTTGLPKDQQQEEFSITNADSNKIVSLLSEIGISAVSSVEDGNSLILVEGSLEQRSTATIVIKLTDSNNDYVIENLGTASAVRKLPSNMQLEKTLGNISIGTFAEPPESNIGPKAIIDIYDDSVWAVIPTGIRGQLLDILTQPMVYTQAESESLLQNNTDKPAESLFDTPEQTAEEPSIAQDFRQAQIQEVVTLSEMSFADEEDSADTEIVEPQQDDSESIQIDTEQEPLTTRIVLQPVSDSNAEPGTNTTQVKAPDNAEDILDMTLPETVTIIQLLDLAGKHLGLNYVYDPKSVGNDSITLKLQGNLRGEMKVKDLYGLLETVLKFKNLAMVLKQDKLVSIVPIDKVLEVDPLLIDEPNEAVEVGDVVVTRMFTLRYIEPAGVTKLLQNMKLGVAISSVDNSRILFVTCYANRMSRIEQLIEMLDKPGTARECRFRRLQYVKAGSVIGRLRSLADELQGISITNVESTTIGPAEQPIRVLTAAEPAASVSTVTTKAEKDVYLDTDERTNRILMIGYEGQLNLIEELIDVIDVDVSDHRILKTYDLRYIEAQEALDKMNKLEIVGNSQHDSAGQSLTIVLENTNQLLIKADQRIQDRIQEFLNYIDVTPEDLRSIQLYKINNVSAESVKSKLAELNLIGSEQTKTESISRTASQPLISESGLATNTDDTDETLITNILSEPKQSIENTLLVTSGSPGFMIQQPLVIVNESSNSLIVKANQPQHTQIAEVIGFIDIKLPEDELTFKIYPLENSSPAHVADMLERLIFETADEEDKIQKTETTEDRITIVPDANTFSLLIYANGKNQQRLSNLIQNLDKRRPQVLIDVTLVEITRTDTFEYDLNLVASANNAVIENIGISPIQTTTSSSRLEGGFNLLDNDGNPTGQTKAFYNDENIQALLTAIQQKKYGRVLAKPKILVDDGQLGQIATTDETTYVKESIQIPEEGTPITTREYVPITAGIQLEITPHISEGNLLKLDVHLSRDDFGSRPDSGAPPDKSTSEVNTTVFVPDDLSVILGGLVKLNQSKGGYKIPLLGDLPLIGALFRSVDNSDIEKKLYVFLKANIVRPSEEAGLADLQELSDEHRQAFEQSESDFQNYQDIPGINPQPMQPESVLNGYK